jgi:hypothetical protein
MEAQSGYGLWILVALNSAVSCAWLFSLTATQLRRSRKPRPKHVLSEAEVMHIRYARTHPS